MMSDTAMKRPGESSEICDTAPYLASDTDSYMNRKIVLVD